VKQHELPSNSTLKIYESFPHGMLTTHADDPELTMDPGFNSPTTNAVLPTVDEPFSIIFDDTYTSPAIMGTGTEMVLPTIDE
jgi:hypothetical protein